MLSLFRALFGDVDVDELAKEGKTITIPFFMSLVVVLVLVMFNMLIAIFMDVYGTVKKRTSHSIPLNQQLWQLWQRRRDIQTGKRVAMSLMLKTLEDESARDAAAQETLEGFEADVKLTDSDLMALLPIKQPQIDEIMTNLSEWLILTGEKEEEDDLDQMFKSLHHMEATVMEELIAVRVRLQTTNQAEKSLNRAMSTTAI